MYSSIGIRPVLYVITFVVVWGCQMACVVTCAQISPQFHAPLQAPDSILGKLQAVCDSVLDDHVDSPTRQTMYLAATRAIYRAVDQVAPQQLAVEFSKISGDSELESAFSSHWKSVKQRASGRIQLGDWALAGMLECVGLRNQYDPLAEQDKVSKQLSENQYIGVGIAVRMDSDFAEITNPIIGGPAHRAGAKPGDLIVAIDGQRTDGWQLGKVVTVLRGPIESKVSVSVRNKNGGDERELNMVRSTVPIPSVHGVQQKDDESWRISFAAHSDVAYLRLSDIVGSTAAEFLKFGIQVENENPKP